MMIRTAVLVAVIRAHRYGRPTGGFNSSLVRLKNNQSRLQVTHIIPGWGRTSGGLPCKSDVPWHPLMFVLTECELSRDEAAGAESGGSLYHLGLAASMNGTSHSGVNDGIASENPVRNMTGNNDDSSA
jgi:hypothetical protein